MIMQLKTLVALLATILTAQAATLPQSPTDYYNVVYAVPEGQNIVQFAGTMRVPHLPHPGYYYLWPGLFLPDYGGVLQPVLSGGTGQWSINNTWYYAITEDPAGQQDVQYIAFGVDEGDDVRFNMQKNDTWSITLTVPGTSKEATNSFPMIAPAKADNIPYATFEIELWSQVWDFGPLTFSDITIVSNGSTSSSWCDDKPASTRTTFQASNVTSSVGNGQVTCSIQSLVLQQPGGNATEVYNATVTPSGGDATATPSDGNATAVPSSGDATATPSAGNATATPSAGNATAAPSTSRGSAPLIYFPCIMLSLTMVLLQHHVL
ncbi:hypothetical protein MSAN_00872600 [Mycena sanguinolenta]|uniref:Uncharacterized protein n=1 Tax=Mycena sanguinolenta TaxID=230812 RepID=A0A8H7DB85_9AGAR|nr:hypothetical protein MSAN_00872600 [Mycena sanguinolenta]